MTTSEITSAEELDRTDPLARWRAEFLIADPETIYLDGNSLGMPPRRTQSALRQVIEEQWAGDLIGSWWKHDWLELPLTVGDELAPILGAAPGQVAVHESTTVGLFQLINVALDLDSGRRIIAVDPGEFPTDRYVCEGIARLRGLHVRGDIGNLGAGDVVVRSLVDYRTAAVADLAGETERARAAGATIVWDLSHAAGVLALDLDDAGVELAVGCSYKFLNGGPGAPAFVYVNRELHERLVQPIWGWFGQSDQFAMERTFSPRPGIGRLLNGTPPVLALTAARQGYAITREAGIEAIQTKAVALTSYATELADTLGLDVISPRHAGRRGGHVAIRHPDTIDLHQQLTAQRSATDDLARAVDAST
jgi:kynureninase